MEERSNIKIENARCIFRNFSGTEGEYNREGDRNFCVIIDNAEAAEELKAEGWNVKTLVDRDDTEAVTYFLKINVKFGKYPPKIYTVTKNRNITEVDESTVGLLDNADIDFVDVEINPYSWVKNDRSGITAYLKTMYVNLKEDAFAEKYAREEYPREDDGMPLQ